MDNDTKGWLMSGISGVACIIGASVICIDLIARLVPRWRHFRIQDSNNFLAGSLSLSAGVMLYSSLYSILPSSKTSLIKAGWEPSPAAFAMIGCFLGGVVGIQFLSKLLHRFIPSHVVDCDHTHKDEEGKGDEIHDEESLQGNPEDRPLLSRELSYDSPPIRPQMRTTQTDGLQRRPLLGAGVNGKASLGKKLAQRMTSFISDSKHICDEGGPCFGYSNPCGNECYRVITKSASRSSLTANGSLNSPSMARFQAQRSASTPGGSSTSDTLEEGLGNGYGSIGKRAPSIASTLSDVSSHHHLHTQHTHEQSGPLHHHHVASNAFLSIGLQTSIAIALHKLPEGFITYATNHANPKLGVTIFMALFIHNITEGFALALPLYLALNSRLKAMTWASILGGASQPLGAGIAALWFKVAQSRDMTPNETVYGVMFAVTAGIMTNVALQLFAESLGLIHNKALCIAMAFVGMGILGFSNALTAS